MSTSCSALSSVESPKDKTKRVLRLVETGEHIVYQDLFDIEPGPFWGALKQAGKTCVCADCQDRVRLAWKTRSM